MNDKQIEALRQWCCAVTYEMQHLLVEHGKNVASENLAQEMEALDELLRKSPDED